MGKAFDHQYLRRVHVQRVGGVVDIEIHGGLVNEIAGPCAAGKTSFLRATQMALGGLRAHSKTSKGATLAARSDHPVRRGEDDGEVELETDDFIIRLKVTDDDAPPHVEIKGKHGGKFSRKDISQWLSVLTFDPTEFAGWDEKRQLEVFRAMAGETWCQVLDEIEAEETRLKDDRLILGREVKALGDPPEEPQGCDEETPNTGALLKELEEAQAFNRAQDLQREKRLRMAEQCNSIQGEIDQLEKKLLAAKRHLEMADEKLSAEPKEQDRIDTAPIQAKIAGASEISARVSASIAAHKQWEAACKQIETKQAAHAAAESKLAEVRQKRTEHMENARLPVHGVTFEGGKILVNGLPLTELSGGEMIDLSADVMMAMNPEFRVMFVQHGEALDQAMFDRLLAKADAANPKIQLWIATVSDMPEEEGDKVGHGDAILIYEGRIVER